MTTVFNRVGRYEIHEQIGRGGMAVVFLATDTLTNQRVALKLVSIESDRDGQQVLEAERWGATLQEEFCRESRFVPVVYDHGTYDQYFFIAMEYLAGRNLSEVIAAGPLPAERAVHIAIQLCEFLQAAEAFERTLDGRQFSRLLHGDLKPRNIRVLDGDEIKVFDFGIAKALSLSRKVTRNDFGSIAYLSPERLESGEIDAQAEFWAVGVLLYEMVSGAQPFRAADTRRLEQLIRARQPPADLDGACPAALKAIVAKLLAAEPIDRYSSATAIRDDLRRFASGEPIVADDEPATRRTHRPTDSAAQGQRDEEITRRTRLRGDAEEPLRPFDPSTSSGSPRVESRGGRLRAVPSAVEGRRGRLPLRGEASEPARTDTPPDHAAPVAAAKAAAPRRGRLRRLARKALIAFAIITALNEIRVYVIASALAENVPQEIGGVIQLWGQHRSLQGSMLNLGIMPLERALTERSSTLADRTFARYRTAGAIVYETEWRLTRDALAFAARAAPSDKQIEAALRYCEGHLRRIDGEARLREKQLPAAQQELTASVTAFRSAAELRPNWPDPFLGLMRAFVAMDDLERGTDALAQAERFGHVAGDREWTLLGEGYLTRAAKLAETEELEPLTRAADAYGKAIEHFTKVAGFGRVARRLRLAERRLKEVQERIGQMTIFAIQSQAS
jgi:serine/threonine protein kinase